MKIASRRGRRLTAWPTIMPTSGIYSGVSVSAAAGTAGLRAAKFLQALACSEASRRCQKPSLFSARRR